jgi:rhodanese-like protein
MPMWRFIPFDAAGAVLWSGAYLGAGYLLRAQLERAADNAKQMGSWLLLLIVVAFAAYAGWKYYQRQKFIRDLRVARVKPEELLEMMLAGDDVTVVDLRHPIEIEKGGARIRGAIWMSVAELEERHLEIPRGKDVVLYCS